jgi:hypothetical protein
MPLAIYDVSQEEWDAAPTAHRVLVTEVHLDIRDHRPKHAAHDVFARMRRLTVHVAQVTRARHVMTHLFMRRPGHDPVLSASTTRVVVDQAEGGPLIHLLAWNGARFVVASYDHGRYETYSLGRLDGERYLWTDELRLEDLAERLNRNEIRGQDLVELVRL